MIAQDQDETPEKVPPLESVKGRLYEDDLEVGQYVCVFNLKREPQDAVPIMGQSILIKAVCLPYFVGQLLSDSSEPILTLDCRFLNMMRVTKEFVDAQREGAKLQQQQGGMVAMAPQPMRRKQEGP